MTNRIIIHLLGFLSVFTTLGCFEGWYSVLASNEWRSEKCKPMECNAKVLVKLIHPGSRISIEDAKKKTLVPIVIPSIKSNLFTEVGYLSKHVYGFDFSTVKGCRGTRSCTYGFIGGELIHNDTLFGDRLINSRYRNRYSGLFGNPREIRLAKGIPGFYVPSLCTAYCGPAMIVWRQDKFQYRVGMYDPIIWEELIGMANSAIENQP